MNGVEVRHRTIEIDGTRIFYREAGEPDAPAVLLLHGFPSSSHQFRFLLPALGNSYHVLAPDYPAFGFSACPDPSDYEYTFDHYADTIKAFAERCSLKRYALYVHDYGAQVGFRLALRAPERVRALVIQNSEAHVEGRTDSWRAMEDYWHDPSPQKRDEVRRKLFTPEGIRNEFLDSGNLPPDIAEMIDPAIISLGWSQVSRPEVVEALLDLHLDYRTNVALYAAFQSYFRQYQPPALIIWGRHDQYGTPEAAEAYKRDLPNAEIRIVEGGHWALESNGSEVVGLAREFLERSYKANLNSRSADAVPAFTVKAADNRIGRKLNILGEEFSVKISSRDTNGAFTVLENFVPPMSGPPLHRHLRQDEWFYIVEGQFLFEADGKKIQAGPGETVFLRQGTRHTLQNVGVTAGRAVVTVVPGGLDLFFEELSATLPLSVQPDPAKLAGLFKKHGLELLGPPLSTRKAA